MTSHGPRVIDYYFSCVSPWTFFGHAPLMAVAERHGAVVMPRPLPLGPLFAQAGGLPLAQRPVQRQHYRILELKRWRDRLGIDFHIAPAHWPFDAQLADKTVIAAQLAGQPVDALLRTIFSGIWQRQENLADPSVIAAAADAVGLPGAELVAAAGGAAAEAAYQDNLERGKAAEVFGAPGYVLDGEVFWGQDRVDFLEDALASGRPAYSWTV